MDLDKEVPLIGSGVLVRSEDKILLMRRATSHGEGMWAAPGGFLEHGEAPEDCAVRELREETSLKVEGVRFVTYTNDLFPDSGKHDITLWFETEHEVVELPPSEEASEIGWFRVSELPEPLFLPLSNLLKKHPL